MLQGPARKTVLERNVTETGIQSVGDNLHARIGKADIRGQQFPADELRRQDQGPRTFQA